MIINLIILQLIVVFIIDISGIIDTIKRFIWRVLIKGKPYQDFEMKPLDCSLCMMFWSGLIYIIMNNEFTLLNILIICLLAFLTNFSKDLYYLVSDLLVKLIITIRKII